MVVNSGGAVTSAVATLTVNCSYALSASSASFSAASAGGSVNVTCATGCAWNVSGVPAWMTINSGSSGNGNGTVSYTVATNSSTSGRSATLTIAGQSYQVTQSGTALDQTPPTISFLSPANGAIVTNTSVTLSGTAADDTGLAQVQWQVGTAPFSVASGTSSWTALATLQSGTNLVSVRAVDLAGNYSPTAVHQIICDLGGTLNLNIKGKGSVKGGANGQKFTVGQQYTLTAQPAPGYVFSNWTGDVSCDLATLTFSMRSDLTLVANFVPNPFVPTKGMFNGLFFETNQVRLGSSGFFTFKLTDKGTYSAHLVIGRKRYPASGHLDLDGRATNLVVRAGTNALAVFWRVDLSGSDQMRGEVSDGNWRSELEGDRACFTATNAAGEAGRYTVLLLGSPGSTVAPQGDGCGTLTVNSRGAARLKISLADKPVLVAAATISKTGDWPLYGSLYAGQGAIVGWIHFADAPGTDLAGAVSWIKPPGDVYYPNGFDLETTLVGSRYAAPILNLSNAVLSVTGGNLISACTNQLSVSTLGRVVNAGPEQMVMSVTPSGGLFTGKLYPPDTATAIRFKGALLQKSGFGSGFFLGTNQSGKVLLQPAP
jgi:hypothetical protein